MILGIYGDSYCNFNLEQNRREGKGITWFEKLAELLGVTKINNYGQPGSSLIRTYQLYKNTNDRNDLNIFVIPALDRCYFSKLETVFDEMTASWYANFYSVKNTIDSFNFANEHKSKFQNDHIKKILDSVLCYYEHWKDTDADVLLNKTFALDLISKETDTVFLYTDNRLFDNSFTLMELTQWEMEQLGWREKFTKNDLHYGSVVDGKWLSDARLCHLSEENNIILAKKIKATMDDKQQIVTLNSEDFVAPSKPLEFYIEWRKL